MPESEDRLRDEEREAARVSPSAARLFDVRRIIGGLFTVYGVIVTVVGLLDSGAELTKARGIRINLWVGIAMLAFGLLFLAWGLMRPVNLGAADQRGDADRSGGRGEPAGRAEPATPGEPGQPEE
jgi:hypothetical protein